MTKDIEVEIRGPLSKEKYQELLDFFELNAKKITERRRILIDYSTFLEGGVADRKKDIRLRVTNGVPEIIVKLGSWGGTDQRRELSALSSIGSFDTLVEIFGALGYNKGMLCERNSKVYEYEGIEFALVEVPYHSYYFEAEKMSAKEEDLDKITEDINKVCDRLGLKTFDTKEFFEYIEQLNRESNEVFDYANYTENYFKDRFKL